MQITKSNDNTEIAGSHRGQLSGVFREKRAFFQDKTASFRMKNAIFFIIAFS